MPLPGGTCASSCEPCSGTCVETGRLGPVCLASCTTDQECRSDEGYVCDPQWHACSIPNLAAIVANHCPGAVTHDPAFSAAELVIAPPTPITPNALIVRTATSWFAVWRDAEAIELATSLDRVTWSEHRNVAADDGSELGAPIVAASPSMLYVMYGEADHGLRVRASPDAGATFTATVTPLAGTVGNAVVDDRGALHIVTLNGTELGGYGSAQQRITARRSRSRSRSAAVTSSCRPTSRTRASRSTPGAGGSTSRTCAVAATRCGTSWSPRPGMAARPGGAP
jgi:hypothetical protein